MSENIFITFLGLGQKIAENQYDYKIADYSFADKIKETKYVQLAELALLSITFDKIIILTTPFSFSMHFDNLKKEIIRLGYNEKSIININVGNEKELDNLINHKTWFTNLCEIIPKNAKITLDITHGFRILPVLLQTAIYFLKAVRDIEIKNLLYGAFEVKEKVKPIIDLSEFISIIDWADAISDFKRNLSLHKLNNQVLSNKRLNFLNLTKEDINLLDTITLMIKSANMIELPPIAHEILSKLNSQKKDYLSTLLIDMIIEKIRSVDYKDNLQYDIDFFKIQFNLIQLLIEHDLIMQAYTIMREVIASLGLLNYDKIVLGNSKGRNKRIYCEIFMRMLENDEWKFHESELPIKEKIYNNIYLLLKKSKYLKELKTLSKKITKIRNAMDHAWTSKSFFSTWNTEKNDDILKKVKNKIESHFFELRNLINKILREVA